MIRLVFSILLVTIFFSIIKCEMEVYWKADVFQYGEDARLECSGHECKKDVNKLWMGGLPYNLLCTDKRSINPDKYDIQLKEDGSVFDLMIKNVSLADVNCRYTCTCGFYHFTRNISAADFFLYPPNAAPIDSSMTKYEDIYLINVNISKVFPLPENCKRSIFFEDIIFYEDLHVNGGKESSGTFSNLQIKSRLDCMKHQALIDVNISCTVRGRIFNVFTENVDCSITRKNDARSLMIICLVTSLLIIAAAVVIGLVKWKRRRQDDAVTEFSDSSVVGSVAEPLDPDQNITKGQPKEGIFVNPSITC